MAQEVYKPTMRIISQLYNDGNLNRAVLASLRGAAEINNPRAQAAWPLIMGSLDADQLSATGVPKPDEVAVYTALHLYANHQQGNSQLVFGSCYAKDEANKGIPLFMALAQLRANPDDQKRLDNRVGPILAATNIKSVIHDLTSLVNIVKSSGHNFVIDYADLSKDLFQFQLSYENASYVRMRWGQAYYRVSKVAVNEEEKSND